MIARLAGVAAVLLLVLHAPARADVGEPAIAVITRLQSSGEFKGVGTDHGTVAGMNLQRWKFETASSERIVFTIDAKNANSPVVRETYVRFTDMDPYSLRPGQSTGRTDLGDVLSPRELLDFSHAAAVATIEEKPVHVVAFFYRGRFAAYQVLEPQPRHPGVQNRFEWRSFALSELDAVMKAARSCDNGPDCATWY
jgi:hypothetical protein